MLKNRSVYITIFFAVRAMDFVEQVVINTVIKVVTIKTKKR